MIFVGLHEAPRELSEGLGLWLFGVAVGAKLAHKHIVLPMRRHHEESMEMHRATHDHLGVPRPDLERRRLP